MRKITIGLLLMALVVMGFGIRVSVEAKGNTQGNDVSQYTSERLGISFDYPSDWQVVESGTTISIGRRADGSEFDPYFSLQPGDAVINLAIFDNVAALIAALPTEEVVNVDDPVIFLQELADGIAETQAALSQDWEDRFGTPYQPSMFIENVRGFNVGDTVMAKADLIQRDNAGIMILTPLPDDAYAILLGVAPEDEFGLHETALDIVAETLVYSPPIINSADYAIISADNIEQLDVLATMQSMSGSVFDFALSPDGRQFALGSYKNVIVYDFASRKINQTFSDEVRFSSVLFSADGTRLLAGKQHLDTEENSVVMWNLESGEVEQALEGLENEPIALEFLDDGNLLMVHTATGGGSGFVVFYETETWTVAKSIEERLSEVTVSSDGSLLAAMGFNKIQVWDIFETPTLLWELEYDKASGTGADLAFSPDDTQLLAVYGTKGDFSDEFYFDVFDPETGASIVEYVENLRELRVVDFTPDGQLVAAGKYYSDLAFVNPASGETIRLIDDAHQDDIELIEFTSDGRIMITIDKQEAIQFWGVK